MSDPGLTRRLRQQSHRSGLAIGASMALAIAVCFGGFTWIYVQLDPWVRDFAGAESAPPTPTPREEASDEGNEEEEPEPEPEDEEPPPEDEEPDQQPAESGNDDDEDSGNIDPVDEEEDEGGGFEPDYQVIALENVNLRSGPGVTFDIVVEGGLPAGTPLEFTGEREPSANPNQDGDTEWLQFEVEGGQEGWIRQIDVGET